MDARGSSSPTLGVTTVCKPGVTPSGASTEGPMPSSCPPATRMRLVKFGGCPVAADVDCSTACGSLRRAGLPEPIVAMSKAVVSPRSRLHRDCTTRASDNTLTRTCERLCCDAFALQQCSTGMGQANKVPGGTPCCTEGSRHEFHRVYPSRYTCTRSREQN
jgi:hypothetical protein